MSHLAPPSKATYVNPGSVIGTSVTFIILGALAVASRFLIRRLRRTFIGPDDWFALAALVYLTHPIDLYDSIEQTDNRQVLHYLVLHYAYRSTAVAIHTEGYHSPPAPHGLQSDETALPPIQVRFKKIQYVLNLTFVLVIGSVRLSILYFYRRIFRGRGFNIAWWSMIVVTGLWTIIFFFASVFQCGRDFSAFWTSFADNAKHCFYIFGEVVALAVTDVALDVAVLVLPLPFVWKLQMPKKQKFGVSFVFLLGLFSVAAGATRMAMNIDVNFLHHPGGTAPVLGLRADDVVGIVGFTLFWQLVQVGVALVACNLLTLRPLYHELWPNGLLSSLRSQLFSSRGSDAHLRREGADRDSNDYAPLNGSTKGVRKLSDAEQHSVTIPLHTLGKIGNTMHIDPLDFRAQKDAVPTVEHV